MNAPGQEEVLERFRPSQLVNAREFQRGVNALMKKLEKEGSLLILRHGRPVAVLHSWRVEQ